MSNPFEKREYKSTGQQIKEAAKDFEDSTNEAVEGAFIAEETVSEVEGTKEATVIYADGFEESFSEGREGAKQVESALSRVDLKLADLSDNWQQNLLKVSSETDMGPEDHQTLSVFEEKAASNPGSVVVD